jgi:VanZ family protein
MTFNKTNKNSREKRKQQWLSLLIFLLFPLFFFGGPDYYSPRSFKNFWNVGHVVFFALLSYKLLTNSSFLKNKSVHYKFIFCLFIAGTLGFTIEYLQSFFGQDVDINDVWRDMLGASIGFFLSPIALNKRTKIWALLILTVLLIFHAVPWFFELADEVNAKRQFPVLSDFESDIEITRWSGDAKKSISDEFVFTGKHSLRVDLSTEKYSGVALSYFPRDWTGYQNLVFEIFSLDDELDITVRINDQLHEQGEQLYTDRFNRKLALHKGWNTINIDLQDVVNAPATRLMDLSRVSNLGVFVTEQPAPKTIYLDSVKLVKPIWTPLRSLV